MASLSVKPASRIISVDVLRGITIAFMILVNDPGDWSHIFAPLEHASWNGCTPTDLVFPTFLFLVGCSIVFAIESRLKRGDSAASIVWQVTKRAALIFAIKTTLSLVPYFHYTHMRLFGVLTRIAICYFFAALIYLGLRLQLTRRDQQPISTGYDKLSLAVVLTLTVLLLGYWLLIRFAPVPGIGLPVRDVPFLDPDKNFAAWLDRAFSTFTLRWLHTGTLYEHTRDPEGLLSTIPAIGTTIAGIWAGLLIRFPRKMQRALLTLLSVGLFDLIAGLLWSHWFPLNKNLWTSSYVLFAAGIAELLLCVFCFLFDVQRLQDKSKLVAAAIWPWLVFGSNAIFAFVLSNVYVKIGSFIKWTTAEGKTRTLTGWIYLHLFSHGNSNEWTSLAYAICFVVACFIPTWLLWRKRIFLRV